MAARPPCAAFGSISETHVSHRPTYPTCTVVTLSSRPQISSAVLNVIAHWVVCTVAGGDPPTGTLRFLARTWLQMMTIQNCFLTVAHSGGFCKIGMRQLFLKHCRRMTWDSETSNDITISTSGFSLKVYKVNYFLLKVRETYYTTADVSGYETRTIRWKNAIASNVIRRSI